MSGNDHADKLATVLIPIAVVIALIDVCIAVQVGTAYALN